MNDVVSSFFLDLLQQYGTLLSGTWNNLLNTVFLLIAARIIYELVASLLPPVRNIAKLIFSPFHLLHVWFQIQIVKNINKRRELQGLSRNQRLSVGISFQTGFGTVNDESSIIISSNGISNLSVREAIAIVNAPILPALAVIMACVLLGPLVKTPIFLAIHLYLLLGALIALMPSRDDHFFVLNTLITKTTISPWYFVYTLVTFFGSVWLYTWKYDEILGVHPDFWWIEPLVMGIFSSWVYLMLLAAVVAFTPAPPEERMMAMK